MSIDTSGVDDLDTANFKYFMYWKMVHTLKTGIF